MRQGRYQTARFVVATSISDGSMDTNRMPGQMRIGAADRRPNGCVARRQTNERAGGVYGRIVPVYHTYHNLCVSAP